MPSIVVDASTLVDLFIGSPSAGSIFERLFRSRADLHVPYSIDLEVASAIEKLARRGLLTTDHASEIIDIYRSVAIHRHTMTRFSTGSGFCGTTSRPTTPHTSRSRSR